MSFAIALVLFALVFYTFIAAGVPRTTDRNTDVISGRVVKVMEGEIKDVALVLQGDPRVYINRGLERGLTSRSIDPAN